MLHKTRLDKPNELVSRVEKLSIMKVSSLLRRISASVLTASFVLTSASILAGSASAQNSADAEASSVQEWTKNMGGLKLVRYAGSTSSGGGSGGYNGKVTVSFCSDGQYFYTSEQSVFIDVPGATGNSGGTNQETGRWKVIDATGDNDSVFRGESVQQYTEQGFRMAAIEVTLNNGQKGYSWIVINPKGELYLNDTRFYRDSRDKVCS